MLTRKTFAVWILVIIIAVTAVCMHAAAFSAWWTGRPSVTPVSVVDDIGRTVVIEEPPKRIVSMAPSITEILFALGLGNKVVGVTYGCDYPPEALKIENISEAWYPMDSGKEPFGHFYIKRIVEQRPDLVIMERSWDDWQLYWFSKVEEAGLNILVLWAKSFEDVLHDIALVGKVTWSQEKATKLVSTLKQRVNAVSEKVMGLLEDDKPRVFATAYYDGLNDPWTFGPGYHKPIHFVHEIIEKAGGINIAGTNEGFFQMNIYEIVRANPQIILVLEDPRFPSPSYGAVMNDGRLYGTEAIQKKAVYEIDQRLWVRPGPRLADAIEEIAEKFYPELFG